MAEYTPYTTDDPTLRQAGILETRDPVTGARSFTNQSTQTLLSQPSPITVAAPQPIAQPRQAFQQTPAAPQSTVIGDQGQIAKMFSESRNARMVDAAINKAMSLSPAIPIAPAPAPTQASTTTPIGLAPVTTQAPTTLETPNPFDLAKPEPIGSTRNLFGEGGQFR